MMIPANFLRHPPPPTPVAAAAPLRERRYVFKPPKRSNDEISEIRKLVGVVPEDVSSLHVYISAGVLFVGTPRGQAAVVSVAARDVSADPRQLEFLGTNKIPVRLVNSKINRKRLPFEPNLTLKIFSDDFSFT